MNKNKWKDTCLNRNVPFKHFLLIMRLAIIILFTSVFSSVAETGFTQNVRVTINKSNVALKEIFNEIEKQTDYLFIYNNEVSVFEKVSIKANQQIVTDVLDELLKDRGIDYFVESEHIMLSAVKKVVKKKTVSLQQQQFVIKGKVTDPDKKPLPGATITIVGTTKGVITDNDGNYSIDASPTDRLVFSFVGMESQVIDINNRSTINIQMGEKIDELEEVTVVAFAKQKKESVISSIETVRPDELKIPSSNLTTSLAGRMSGLISYQRSGEPGQDNAEFFIRGVTTFGYKKNPLILIDNIELSTDDLARLHPDDIASFSIMKDATATALYGSRGANGVILITTKEGREGKTKVSVRVENSISKPTKEIGIASPIDYMLLHNEAVRTRNPLDYIPYSQEKVENTIKGLNPYIYPANDFQDILLKNFSMNQRLNFNISGGGKVSQYYLAGGATQDNGILNVDKRNNFNSNIDLKRYLIRSNININLTNTTEAIVRVHGTFDDYRGPINGGAETYRSIMRSNPVLFPPYYPVDAEHEHTDHILFGNYGEGGMYLNPYAEMMKGYKEYSKSLMLAQIEFKQKLDFVTDGLQFRLLGNTTRNAYFDITRSYKPFYYSVAEYDKRSEAYKLGMLNPDGGHVHLDYSEGQKLLSSTFYAESAIDYNRTFAKKHTTTGLLVGTVQQSLTGNPGDLQLSLPTRNIGLSGRITYAYDTRIFGEFNFGYNGSERFSKNERFGFFPSIGIGWLMSKEKFWIPLSNVLTTFKVKLTHGLVGNDAIGSASDRFFYLSNVNMDNSSKGYSWGTDNQYSRNGISISRYANNKITWEVATKTNLGTEFSFFDKIMFNVDLFKEYRRNILMNRLTFATLGLQSTPKANVGEASSRGIDLSIDVQHNFNNNFWLTARGNFTYANGIFEKYEEPDYSATPWMSKVGQPINQSWGYIAERLFVDDAEVVNSPVQELGSIVRGGDIKYYDINGDDKITSIDQVPIGYPTTPEIIYGFGVSSGFKNFDFSFFFQGSARSSFWIDARATSPFVSPLEGTNNAMLQAYVDSHWSEANRDIYALWPRLSASYEENNLVRSTWFMENGAFLRLKSLEAGYSIPKSLYQRLGVDHIRFYLNGINLLTFSSFKQWDPEMGGNGLGYPIQKVFNTGLQITF